MRWVTREHPKIDRIACPWLVGRFIDNEAEFLYVPAGDVARIARETGAIPYDIPGVELTHDGELCSFDAFLKKYGLDDPALQQLAIIVRGADTSRLDLTPQSAGLYALSLGLSQNFTDDQEMLKHGLVMYDALYAWCKNSTGETHNWPPKCDCHQTFRSGMQEAKPRASAMLARAMPSGVVPSSAVMAFVLVKSKSGVTHHPAFVAGAIAGIAQVEQRGIGRVE